MYKPIFYIFPQEKCTNINKGVHKIYVMCET